MNKEDFDYIIFGSGCLNPYKFEQNIIVSNENEVKEYIENKCHLIEDYGQKWYNTINLDDYINFTCFEYVLEPNKKWVCSNNLNICIKSKPNKSIKKQTIINKPLDENDFIYYILESLYTYYSPAPVGHSASDVRNIMRKRFCYEKYDWLFEKDLDTILKTTNTWYQKIPIVAKYKKTIQHNINFDIKTIQQEW